VFDLEEELHRIRLALRDAGIQYALCGGLAVGVHGYPRATVAIDLLIRPGDELASQEVVAALGYVIKARPMRFSDGAMEIRRISKIDPLDGETLMVDFLLVTPLLEEVWRGRERLTWRGDDLFVVSREGLVALKRLRGSEQDLADIARLQAHDETD
jgi:hypothetical protein